MVYLVVILFVLIHHSNRLNRYQSQLLVLLMRKMVVAMGIPCLLCCFRVPMFVVLLLLMMNPFFLIVKVLSETFVKP